MRLRLISLILGCAAISGVAFAQTCNDINGEAWVDTDGNRINCHGGNIIVVDSTYYWYGEHRPGFEADRQLGVNCYSSRDLRNWRHEGIVLATTDEPGSPLERGGIIERPKVVHNPRTGEYVMWFHHELKGRGYAAAEAAVAVSDSPTGPFRLIDSSRVNPGEAPLNLPESELAKAPSPDKFAEWWTPEWYDGVRAGMFTRRDLDGGQMARDQTIFIDDDGTAYHVYSSEENLTLNVAELTDDYRGHTGRYVRVAPGSMNEAPVVFKHDGRYWMITSGCTGWAPNAARLHCADSMLGEWQELPNPCVGEGADTTFGSQGAFPLVIDGETYFVADQWRPNQLADSRTLILPILYNAQGRPVLVNTPEVPVVPRGGTGRH